MRCTTSQNPKRCGLLEQASRWHQRSRRALLAFERFKLLPYGTGKASGEVWGALAGHTRLEYGWTSGARAAIATLFSTILVIPGSLNIVLSRCLSTLIKAVLCGWCRSPVARRLAHTLGRMGRAKFQPAQRVRMTGWIFETQTSFAKLGLASGTARSTVVPQPVGLRPLEVNPAVVPTFADNSCSGKAARTTSWGEPCIGTRKSSRAVDFVVPRHASGWSGPDRSARLGQPVRAAQRRRN